MPSHDFSLFYFLRDRETTNVFTFLDRSLLDFLLNLVDRDESLPIEFAHALHLDPPLPIESARTLQFGAALPIEFAQTLAELGAPGYSPGGPIWWVVPRELPLSVRRAFWPLRSPVSVPSRYRYRYPPSKKRKARRPARRTSHAHVLLSARSISRVRHFVRDLHVERRAEQERFAAFQRGVETFVRRAERKRLIRESEEELLVLLSGID